MTDQTPPVAIIEDERILTPADVVTWLAARDLEMSEQSVRRHIESKQFPGYQVAGRYLIPLPWLRRWLLGLPPKKADLDRMFRADVPPPVVIPFVGRKTS